MKKALTVSLGLFLGLALATGAWAGAFELYYDYENQDGTYSYYFETGSGIFVTMDQEWYQNTRVVIEDSGISFFHEDSYNAYAEEGYRGGWLFTIGASVNSSFQDLPHFTYIGFDEENVMNYYAELPTDYQAYTGDESIRAEYDVLWSGVDDVIAGIRIGSNEGKTGTQETNPMEKTLSETEPDAVPDVAAPVMMTSGDYEYFVNDDAETITICDYLGNADVVEIPSEIDGYRVADIGPQAFSYARMKQVSIPTGIRSIGQRAFEYGEMEDVTIPAGATVDTCAFGYCDSLKQVLIGADAVIRSRAFGYCDNLETVVCAQGSRLESDTFEYCRALKDVILCGTVEVEEGAFYECSNMKMTQADESEFENRKLPEPETGTGSQDSLQADLQALLFGGKTGDPGDNRKAETLADGEHRITLTGDTDVFVDCPPSAKAGETVTVNTVDVADGIVKIKVNGIDVGTWTDWGTYTFTMPDGDVEVYGWISTAGYPGA